MPRPELRDWFTTQRAISDMRHIQIWAFDAALASGISGVIDVFTAANAIWEDQNGAARGSAPLFEWRVVSREGEPIRTPSGQILQADGPITGRTVADAVIVPGPFMVDDAQLAELLVGLHPVLPVLRRQHTRGAIVGSYCTGTFLLAEAGLLDGRVATTHWAKARLFEQWYPRVLLRINEVITEHHRLICTGAVTTYLNLAIRVVERLAGAALASAVARRLLVDTNRISQASYAMLTVQDHQSHCDALVARAQRWMEKHVRESFRLSDLAGHLAVSERTLNRRFKRALGQAPLRYLQAQRIEIAKRLLETRGITVDAVSDRVGYGDVSAFRQLFKRETGVSPREYQRRFSRRHQGRTLSA